MKYFYTLLVIVLVWVLYTTIRSVYFNYQTDKLFTQSATFPRDYYVGLSSDTPITYIALGDSTTQGTGASSVKTTLPHAVAEKLAAAHQYVHVINRGISGARMADLVTNQLSGLADLHPTIVTVQGGANDATHFTNLESYTKSLLTVIGAVQSSGATTILMANTPDMSTTPALFYPLTQLMGQRAAQQNAILTSSVQGTNIHIIDIYGAGKLLYNQDPHLFAADHFHPSNSGYQKWIALFDTKL